MILKNMIEFKFMVCEIYAFPSEADKFFKIKYHDKIAYGKKIAIRLHNSRTVKQSLFVTNAECHNELSLQLLTIVNNPCSY